MGRKNINGKKDPGNGKGKRKNDKIDFGFFFLGRVGPIRSVGVGFFFFSFVLRPSVLSFWSPSSI